MIDWQCVFANYSPPPLILTVEPNRPTTPLQSPCHMFGRFHLLWSHTAHVSLALFLPVSSYSTSPPLTPLLHDHHYQYHHHNFVPFFVCVRKSVAAWHEILIGHSAISDRTAHSPIHARSDIVYFILETPPRWSCTLIPRSKDHWLVMPSLTELKCLAHIVHWKGDPTLEKKRKFTSC